MKDYYKILGLTPAADKKEIKKAFRQLAKKYHPDLNPGDAAAAEQFKLINEACQVLSDENKRARYDLDRKKQQGESRRNSADKTHSQQTKAERGSSRPDFSKAFSKDAFEEAFFAGMKNPSDHNNNKKKDPLDTSAIFQRFFGFS